MTGLLRIAAKWVAQTGGGYDTETRRGLEAGTLSDLIEKMPAAELGPLVLELVIEDVCDRETREAAAKLVGVDIKAVEKEAKAALSAEGKAAEKKVAAVAKKPEREIVVKQPKSKGRGKKS
jgi:hypothetical protein